MSFCVKEDLRLGSEYGHLVCHRASCCDKFRYFYGFGKWIGPVASSCQAYRVVLEKISLLTDNSKQQQNHEQSGTDDFYVATFRENGALFNEIIKTNAHQNRQRRQKCHEVMLAKIKPGAHRQERTHGKQKHENPVTLEIAAE